MGNFPSLGLLEGIQAIKQKGSRTLISSTVMSNLKGLYFTSDSFLDPFAFSGLFYFSSVNYSSSFFPQLKKTDEGKRMKKEINNEFQNVSEKPKPLWFPKI